VPDRGVYGLTMSPPFLGIGAVPTMLVRLGAALLFALPLAWERKAGPHHVGLRTIPLVSLGACGYMLFAERLIQEPEARTRVLQGLLSGIGFIGGGAIFKEPNDVSGIATAATIWNMGAIGAATGDGDYWLALLLSFASIVVLVFGIIVGKIKSGVRSKG
jgi:putative Mg2+ transporter-C (MgtC) family protein